MEKNPLLSRSAYILVTIVCFITEINIMHTISGEMIVRFSVIVATISWCADCYIEDLCPNCNLYQDSAEVSIHILTVRTTKRLHATETTCLFHS